MSAPLIQRSVAQDLYVYGLQSVYNGYRVYDPDFALSRDADAYEKVRRDPVLAHAFQQRLHKVAGKDFNVAPSGTRPQDKLAAALVEEALRDNLENLTEARYEAAQAVLFARSFLYICGERRRLALGGLRDQDWWVPTRLEDVDRRRFRFRPLWDTQGPTRKLKVCMEMYSLERSNWEVIEHPEWFVRHVYQDEEARLGHGRGLLEAVYFYWWMRTKVLEEGVQWVERWAQGLITAQIDGLRPASADKDNEKVRNAWIDVFKAMRGRNVLVHGKEDEVTIHDPPGTGADMVIKFLEYLDAGITRLVVGEVRASGGVAGDGAGSRAQASVEAENSEAMVQYDRTLLDETLTRDLVGAFWRNNRPQLAMSGMADAKRPRFESVQERRENPERAVDIITKALGAGIPLKREEVYRKLGMTPPSENDEVIEGHVPAPNPFMPGGFPGEAPRGATPGADNDAEKAEPSADGAALRPEPPGGEQ